MSSENSDTIGLTDSLCELSMDLVQKNDETQCLQNQLEGKISEISELKANLGDLQAQLQQTAEELKQSESKFDGLQSKYRNLELDLVKKDDELNRTKKQLEIQTIEVRCEINKRSALEYSNKLLAGEIRLMANKLSNTKTQLQLAIQEMQAEKEKRIQKCNEWNTKCQTLQNECFEYENELESYKQLQKLTDRIAYTRERIVNGAGAKDRTVLYNEIEKMTSVYKQKSEKLEHRNVVIPQMNFSVLLKKYHGLYKENTVQLQDRLKRIDEIKEESKSLCVTQNVVALEDLQKAVHKYFSQLGQLEWASVDNLEEEEELYEQVKDAYQEAKQFFKSAFNK